MSSIVETDNATPTLGWLLDPATSLLTFSLEERRLANITERSLFLIGQMDWLLGLALEKVRTDDPKSQAAIKGLMEIAQGDAAFASEEYESGCPKTYAHHAVSLWGSIESGVEQLLVNHLRVVPSAADLVASTPRGLAKNKIDVSTESDARDTVRRWQSRLQNPSALGGPIEMLHVFDVDVALSAESLRELDELAEIRNVILHRGGVVDARFVRKRPVSKWKVGDSVRLSEATTRGYFDAAGEFALALVRAVTASPYRSTLATL